MLKIRKESLLRRLKITGIRLVICTVLVSSVLTVGWIVPEVRAYTKSTISHSTDIKTAGANLQSFWGEITNIFGMIEQ